MDVAGDTLAFGIQSALLLQTFQAPARAASFHGPDRASHAGQQAESASQLKRQPFPQAWKDFQGQSAPLLPGPLRSAGYDFEFISPRREAGVRGVAAGAGIHPIFVESVQSKTEAQRLRRQHVGRSVLKINTPCPRPHAQTARNQSGWPAIHRGALDDGWPDANPARNGCRVK